MKNANEKLQQKKFRFRLFSCINTEVASLGEKITKYLIELPSKMDEDLYKAIK